MRLLSIFALLFLISLLLHGGLKDQGSPDEQADGENVEDIEDATDGGAMSAEQEDFSSFIFSQPFPARHFDFEQDPVFSMIEVEIKNLIIGRNDDSFKEKNHLCAVGYEFLRRGKVKGFAKKEVVVYWKEAKALYRWKGGDPKVAEQDFYNAISLLFSRSIPLDPGQGVIGGGNGEGEAEDKFVNYKERAENVIADCEKHGKLYEIDPFAPPPRGFKQPEGGGRPRPAPATPPAPPVAPASSPLVHASPDRFAGAPLG